MWTSPSWPVYGTMQFSRQTHISAYGIVFMINRHVDCIEEYARWIIICFDKLQSLNIKMNSITNPQTWTTWEATCRGMPSDCSPSFVWAPVIRWHALTLQQSTENQLVPALIMKLYHQAVHSIFHHLPKLRKYHSPQIIVNCKSGIAAYSSRPHDDIYSRNYNSKNRFIVNAKNISITSMQNVYPKQN